MKDLKQRERITLQEILCEYYELNRDDPEKANRVYPLLYRFGLKRCNSVMNCGKS